MSAPYKDVHDMLIAGLGTPAKYHEDWKAISADLANLVVASGFNPRGKKIPDMIRAKLAAGATEAAVLRAGALAPARARLAQASTPVRNVCSR